MSAISFVFMSSAAWHAVCEGQAAGRLERNCEAEDSRVRVEKAGEGYVDIIRSTI